MRGSDFDKISNGLIGGVGSKEEKIALNRWSMLANSFIVLSISASP